MGFNEQLAEVIKQHDKEIRNGAIEEFLKAIKNHYKIYGVIPSIRMLGEIADKLKEK